MQVRPGLEALKPYSIDENRQPIKLDANEKPDELLPQFAQALQARLAKLPLNRYPEIAAVSLRGKLAASLNCSPEQIQIGNGSSELLAAICHVFGGAGRRIVFPEPSFSMYPVYARLADSEPVAVKLAADYSLPIDSFLQQAAQANLAIICNPNNPTGNALPIDVIADIARKLPCPLVIDEAYFEFYKQSAVSLLQQFPQLIVVRTFSKAYGLAAARVGYLITSAAVSALIGKVLLPYHVSSLALTAAETVLDYQAEFVPGIENILAERERLAAQLTGKPNITVYPSATNFLLIKTANAAQLAAMLKAAGVGIRDFSNTPELAGCLRLTVGSKQENDLVIEVIERFCSSSDGQE